MAYKQSITCIMHLCPRTSVPSRAVRASLPLRQSPTDPYRTLATHRSNPTIPPTSSKSATSKPTSSTSAESMLSGKDSVGPFPLGVGPSGRSKPWKKWRELGISGKLVRATQQSGNLTIILVGASLLVVLTISLTTELFASNSPSVLYSRAIDLIRQSDALNPHLLPPLKFTHTPHSSSPTRGSTPLPHRAVRNPTSGRDHLLLTFFIHSRGKDEPERFGWFKRSRDVIEGYGREFGVWAGWVEASSPSLDARASEEIKVAREDVGGSGSGGNGGLGRWFGNLTTKVSEGVGKVGQRGLIPPAGTYTSGEVHGDYVKNAAGTYQLLSLTVDIPSSHASYPSRAVIFWSPEADTEGILGPRPR